MAAAPATALPLLDAARRAEADDLVGAVAERAHARLAAAAQRHGAPADLDLVAVLVGEPERAAHEQRSVAVVRDRRLFVHVAARYPCGAVRHSPPARRTRVARRRRRGMGVTCCWRDAGSSSPGC